jgi:DNA-directed RNA polymerase specialized sigma24 family protein
LLFVCYLFVARVFSCCLFIENVRGRGRLPLSAGSFWDKQMRFISWLRGVAVNEVLNRIEKQQNVEPELPENIGALPLLQLAHREKVRLTPQQARCAIEALAYENPKLSATAIATMGDQSFAEALERAIARARCPVSLQLV